MINVNKNDEINNALDNLYREYTSSFLNEWQQAFHKSPPCSINKFGIINTQKFDYDNGILFIGKETNNWSDYDYSRGYYFRQWMYEITDASAKNEYWAPRYPRMWYNVARWAMLISDPKVSIEEICSLKGEALQHIGKIAFTNINKVRGNEQSRKEFHELAQSSIVGDVLKKEIEIIHPKIIVCCGTGWFVDRHLPDIHCKIIYLPHPGARISTRNMLSSLKTQLDQV